jgi:PncC family amidohydrolase
VKPEQALGRLLRSSGLTLSVAESCTGGRLADRLTDVPGSSEYFAGGIVAYSNKVKTDRLKVRTATLARYGAVSRQTVEEMAMGVAGLFQTRVAIAVSGVAGPGGGTRAKPVGLVYIAVRAGKQVAVEERRFSGSRSQVKTRAVTAALRLCRRALERR